MSVEPPHGTKLNELTKEEFREVARKLSPKMTDDEYNKAWGEFQEMKRRKKLS